MRKPADCNIQDLVRRLKLGDETAFTAIYNVYWKQLFYVVHKRLHSLEDSKEIIQSVFFTLWEKRAQLEIADLNLYLSAMTRHAVYKHLARQKRGRTYLREQINQHNKSVSNTTDYENKFFLQLLNKFSDSLPDKYRIVFVQHKLLDKPIDEIATQLGVSPRTVEGYVSKVMTIMRDHGRKIAF
ncbi:sigma-70 family RNA polymerase sigma factor [Pseudoflavitalea sp. G-6-1-2]|uniref:RNA polymerase sigma factor n=1 Tax=Pseudoflavitalea sp. G-6-1-2 TaxID=2728841 RepID=UPI00146CE067|nr:sigma-70 family RNA polymerase sigma factor [Pseudoflavitalea sp. G-6-1-2]NML23278.1 sigma-70 family RNA polymerase sigma factor [Pseudoflavitalea sp. G-6-1-2]